MANDKRIPVKQELIDPKLLTKPTLNSDYTNRTSVIDLSSSDSDTDSSSSDDNDNSTDLPRDSSHRDGYAKKKRRIIADEVNALLPLGFLEPLPSKKTLLPIASSSENENCVLVEASNKQFWKAGDYEGASGGDWSSTGGTDHVRVHPKFLHSNATSHKWVLGAFAELLDNSLDEVCNGATYVHIDMVESKKNGSKLLLIEDDGGGMDPDKIRHCMSFGYSVKSKIINTIGQYGNGFKTSTMRLGADVIVFSRCRGKDGRSTQSVGLLSYTFLKNTRKEDIVVPMLDYERRGQDWNKLIRSSAGDRDLNVETVVQWSPFSSEADLLRQFNHMKDHGTRIIIYNLWEDDEGLLELDFDSDPHDIQIRGVNRDEKSIEMANKHPNSRHFLTYRHSLRSYAAILYLRVPPVFRIILRGKDVDHHNIVNDMMMSQEVIYRPQPGADGILKGSDMVAVVNLGFVKDAKAHIDVQGFNVYHKNRLIKPFWRVWHPAGSQGRGVIGVLEANFVEPAHDKQGFERTTVLARLETKLIQMQKNYWHSNSDKIGYAPTRNKTTHEKDTSPDSLTRSLQLKKTNFALCDKTYSNFQGKGLNNGYLNGKEDVRIPRKRPRYAEQSTSSEDDIDCDDRQNHTPRKQVNGLPSRELLGKVGSERPSVLRHHEIAQLYSSSERSARVTRNSNPEDDISDRTRFSSASTSHALTQLKEENHQLKERLKRKEEILGDLLQDIQKERDGCSSLEAQLQEETRKYDELSKEQESIIEIFSEERNRREIEEEKLRKKLKEASNTIEQLVDKVKMLEKRR